MHNWTKGVVVLAASAAIAGCATIAPPSPVEVTRFHDAAGLSAVRERTVFITSAPGENADSLELASYKHAVAAELASLGYSEAPRSSAAYTAEVSLDQFVRGNELARRGPVNVGVGGRTGSYGSGVGLGIGINLGGNRNRERVGTEVGVMLKDRANGNTIWEGRAGWDVDAQSELAASQADTLVNALFSEFPGGNGETIEIRAK